MAKVIAEHKALVLVLEEFYLNPYLGEVNDENTFVFIFWKKSYEALKTLEIPWFCKPNMTLKIFQVSIYF